MAWNWIKPWLYIALSSLMVLAVSCGLPENKNISEPGRVYYDSDQNKVGFISIADPLITGYEIYYKIYALDSPRISEDESKFDPAFYENNNMPSGNAVPRSLGFHKMGFVGESNPKSPLISLSSGGKNVTISFADAISQGEDRDPVLSIDSRVVNTTMGIPARGVKYSGITNINAYASNNTFKRFVLNYEFENPYNQKDGDIKKALGEGAGENITIAFAVTSYGLDPSSLRPIVSLPIHIGTVYQNNFVDNDENAPNYQGL